MKEALTVTVAMFRRVVLETNMEKIKSLMCNPGYIWGGWSYEEYKCQATGGWAEFKERNRLRVCCEECGVTLAVLSLKGCMGR